MVVLGLNFLHSDFRHVPAASLGRQPTELHLNIFDRLRSMLRACSERGVHPLAAGRRGPHLIARLRELNSHLSGLGLSTFPYLKGASVSGFVPHDANSPEALRPHRDADPDRLKVSGSGAWGLEGFLSPELRLAYREPCVLRAIPGNELPFPDADGEDRENSLRLMKLWDSKGLLYVSFQKKEPRELTRVFGAFKSEVADRQIGDRRGANSLEGRLEGPSLFLPPGHMLCQLTAPPGAKIIGATTDRADFYHQAKTTAAKSEGNCIGSPVLLRDLRETSVVTRARALAASVAKGGEPRRAPSPFDAACIVSPVVPRPSLFDDNTVVRGAFRSLYQGDHAGVEFATQAHASLLQSSGLLSRETQLLAKKAPSRCGPWEALIIDDYFVLSSEDAALSPEKSTAAKKVAIARECYERSGVAGNPHKDVNGADFFQAAGAQVNSTSGPVSEGRVYVSAPTPKLLAPRASLPEPEGCIFASHY